MEEREREGRRTGEVEETVVQSLEWKPLLEESSRHWGVRVGGGGRCGVCHSHLSLALSGHLPGILLFHCGNQSFVVYTQLASLSLSLSGGGKHLHCNGDYNEEWIYAMIILPR